MLVIKSLTKTYANGIRAMQDISLNIDHGIFGLLGPNGAGKSTLIRTLTLLANYKAVNFQLFIVSYL